MVAGIPAKVIGYIQEQDPSLTMKHGMSCTCICAKLANNNFFLHLNGNLGSCLLKGSK
jgi:hypothetical protein